MALETVTREEFDRHLVQSTEQMRQKRLTLEAQAAVLEDLIDQYSSVLERLEAEAESDTESLSDERDDLRTLLDELEAQTSAVAAAYRLRKPIMKRSFSKLSLKEAMELVPARSIAKWNVDASQRTPSDVLLTMLRRFESFDLTGSEPAKVMLIDLILSEIVPLYPQLKVWKGEALESETVAGIADYLIAPHRAYVDTPLLCTIEAKRDDFEAGRIQCIAEMAVCQQNNSRNGFDGDIYGIVSNGQVWAFYRLALTSEIYVSQLFTTDDLPKLLGALDQVCASCAANVPASAWTSVC